MSRALRRGVVAIEASVALLVIGLVSIAVLELFAMQLRAAGRGPRLLAAAALAQDRLAAVRLFAAGQPRLPDSLARGEFAAPFEAYRWRAHVTPSRDGTLEELRVEVSWTGGDYSLITREATIASTPTLAGRP